MTIRNRPVILLAVLAGLSAWAPARSWALSSDRSQPMKIVADQVNVDDKRQVSVYRGNVIVVQGTMRVTADTLTVYLKQRALQKLIAAGKPSTYKQLPDNKKQDVHAEARRIEYYADRDTVILINNAVLWQGANTFRSNRIVYDLGHDKVDAGDKAGKDRVEITIQPQTNKTADKP